MGTPNPSSQSQLNPAFKAADRKSAKPVGSEKIPCPLMPKKYQLRLQLYNRLMYHDDPISTVVGDQYPDNTFCVSPPSQFKPYFVKNGLAVLSDPFDENGVSESKETTNWGRIDFDEWLDLGKGYRVECDIRNQGESIPIERITCNFRVDSLPASGASKTIPGQTRHSLTELIREQVGQPPKSAVREIESEEVKGTLRFRERAMLELPLVVDTYALDVRHRSQHKHGPYSFEVDGAKYQVELEHLCLTTCMTMLLNYHGISTDEKGVCEAAARHLLHSKNIQGRWTLSLEGDKVKIRPTGESKTAWPHENAYVIAGAVRDLIKSKGLNWMVRLGKPNLVTSSRGQFLRYCLAEGWPVILIATQEGFVDHATLCRGASVSGSGALQRIFVNDPWNEAAHTISVDGSKSAGGWMFICRKWEQADITPQRLVNGGSWH